MTEAPAKPTLLDRVFAVGVIVKGIDGAVELIVGLALLFASAQVDALLDVLLGKALQGPQGPNGFLATVIAHADSAVASGGTTFLIVFLIAHGVIKLALVYALLGRIVRAYPWAIGILIAFLAYQVYAMITAFSVGQVLFSVLDVVIIVLVWREYRELRGRQRLSEETPTLDA